LIVLSICGETLLRMLPVYTDAAFAIDRNEKSGHWARIFCSAERVSRFLEQRIGDSDACLH